MCISTVVEHFLSSEHILEKTNCEDLYNIMYDEYLSSYISDPTSCEWYLYSHELYKNTDLDIMI